MAIHQSDPNRRPDEEYIAGEYALLVEGNRCRLLDGRRTPGVIEGVDERAGFFRWRIARFEDAGRHWDVPLERVTSYQFERGSARHDAETVARLRSITEALRCPLIIPADPLRGRQFEAEIANQERCATRWLDRESEFFRTGAALSLGTRQGPPSLASDLERYLKGQSETLWEIERRTAETMVLNPDSGEWIKGMLIVLAEAGLVTYSGTVVRSSDLFEGAGSKTARRAHWIHRLAFVRAFFRKAGYEEIVVYRGLSSERDLAPRARSFISCTLNLRVARAFADFDRDSRFRTSLLVKSTVPVDALWMTHCETGAMNGRYAEAEALVLNALSHPFP